MKWLFRTAIVIVLIVMPFILYFSVGSDYNLYMFDLKKEDRVIECIAIDESVFYEGRRFYYISLRALGSRGRSWFERVFMKDERDDYSTILTIELRDWLEKQRARHPALDKTPEFELEIMARIPKQHNSGKLQIPNECILFMLTSSKHGGGFLRATSGDIDVIRSRATMTVSGHALLRYAPPGLPVLSTANDFRLEFQDINIVASLNVLDEWERRLLPMLPVAEIQSWVEEESVSK